MAVVRVSDGYGEVSAKFIYSEQDEEEVEYEDYSVQYHYKGRNARAGVLRASAATNDAYVGFDVLCADEDSFDEDEFDKNSGRRRRKKGGRVRAGVLSATAACDGFAAQVKGPNISAGVEESDTGVKVYAGAELASASASAGPVKAKVGLSAETGVGVGKDGVEAKVLGTGFSLGRKFGISVFGSGFEIDLW
uniref:Uncharacterized protein n=2 Tax=Sphaeramia orbicularis TaxID=375764 RepID=A0A673A375_9TELE